MASDSAETWGTEVVEVALQVPRPAPTGDIVLSGARILTMEGEEVIEAGDIWVQGNRIMEVGPAVSAPAGARTIDVSGATIMPGLVDVHSPPQDGGGDGTDSGVVDRCQPGVWGHHDPESQRVKVERGLGRAGWTPVKCWAPVCMPPGSL